jgi:hypothetical protein
MNAHILMLIALERNERITPREHFELLEVLRGMGVTVLEALCV